MSKRLMDITHGNTERVPKKIKLYIARDDYSLDFSDEDEPERIPGELHIFYDKAELVYSHTQKKAVWANARVIGTPPSYMYPELRECQIAELSTTITPSPE